MQADTSRNIVQQAIKFQSPQRLPIVSSISPATFKRHGKKLKDLAEKYPGDFGWEGWHVSGDGPQQTGLYTDEWNCVWEKLDPLIGGQCVKHPLDDWKNWQNYKLPDPLAEFRWENVPQAIEAVKAQNKYLLGGGGHLFERILALRGFENTLTDLALQPPQLNQLIDAISQYAMKTIKRAAPYKVDGFIFGDDWGQQDRLFIAPKTWRKFFFPIYCKWFKAAHQQNSNVHFHTDGNVTEILPDLLQTGADELNLQLGVLDIDKTAAICRDKICIRGEPDRQHILPKASPQDIRAYTKDLIEAFHTPKGGFIMSIKINHDTPWKNIVALFESLDPYL